MKVKKEKLYIVIGMLITAMFVTVSVSLLAQQRAKDKSSDEMTNAEPVKVVKRFWELSEKGDFEEAKKLRTNTKGEFTFEIRNNFPVEEREVIIFKSGLSLISIEQIEIITESEWEIAVKVKNRDGRKFYLFHNVVKNDDGWKIFATSL